MCYVRRTAAAHPAWVYSRSTIHTLVYIYIVVFSVKNLTFCRLYIRMAWSVFSRKLHHLYIWTIYTYSYNISRQIYTTGTDTRVVQLEWMSMRLASTIIPLKTQKHCKCLMSFSRTIYTMYTYCKILFAVLSRCALLKKISITKVFLELCLHNINKY